MVTQLLRYQEGDFYISIHTTTQVVTEKIVHSNYTEDISIHTTTQVVTDAAGMPTLRTFISIHTTTQVVTLRDILGIMRPIKFQSTPPRRW